MRLSFLLTGFLAVAICAPSGASVIPMKDLIEGDLCILHGDKLFDQFEYYATGDMPTAADVNVITFIDQEGNYGLTFQGGFADLYGDGPSDALIYFRVTVLDPHKWISDAHIDGNPVATDNAIAIVQVDESFFSQGNRLAESMVIRHIPPSAPVTADAEYFAGIYKTLIVHKDILAYAKSEGSAATITEINQSFSQVYVPEPSTLAALVLGLAFAVCFVRRNRR